MLTHCIDESLLQPLESKDIEEGDQRYMAKELLDPKQCNDLSKADVFSLGLTLYGLLLGEHDKLPGNGAEWHALRDGTAPGRLDNGRLQSIVVGSMMLPDYQKRPSAEDVLKQMDASENENDSENQAALANHALSQLSGAKVPLVEKSIGVVKADTKTGVTTNSGSLIGTKIPFNGVDSVVTSVDEENGIFHITLDNVSGKKARKEVSRAVLDFPVGTKVTYHGDSFVVSKQTGKKVEINGDNKKVMVLPRSLVRDE